MYLLTFRYFIYLFNAWSRWDYSNCETLANIIGIIAWLRLLPLTDQCSMLLAKSQNNCISFYPLPLLPNNLMTIITMNIQSTCQQILMSEYSLQWNSILHDFEIISLCADATTYCENVWSVKPRRDQFLYCLHSVFLIGRKQSKRAYQTNGRFHMCSYAYMSVYQESGIKNSLLTSASMLECRQ